MVPLNPSRPSPVPSAPPLDLAPVVLIADNEATLLELFRDAWRTTGSRVLTATNGREALALAEWCVPDVLVTDVVMPRLDGFGLVGAVRRLYPDIPVIIMTGDATYRTVPSRTWRPRSAPSRPSSSPSMSLTCTRRSAG